MAGAPWWAAGIWMVLATAIPATVLLIQVLIPEESVHKLDLWREILRHLEWRRPDRRGGRRKRG